MKKPEVQTIPADELCALTGLTDRRHRQLAKEGFFPSPVDGIYQRDATLAGMFRYYRELGQRNKDLKKAIDEEKLRAARRNNEEEEQLLVKKAAVKESMTQSMVPIRTILKQKLENEMPLAMAGMSLPEARIIGGRLFDEICNSFQAIIKEWTI